MSETPGVNGTDSDEDENVVLCPACDSANTVQFAARGIQYHCRDCNNEFDPSPGPMTVTLN
jgi:ribosomal protein L37AE/L43A